MQVYTAKALNSSLLKDGPQTHTRTHKYPKNDRTNWSLLRPSSDLSASCGLQAGRSGERRDEPRHRRATLAVPAGTGVTRALGCEEEKDGVDHDRPDRLPGTSAPARRDVQVREMLFCPELLSSSAPLFRSPLLSRKVSYPGRSLVVSRS